MQEKILFSYSRVLTGMQRPRPVLQTSRRTSPSRENVRAAARFRNGLAMIVSEVVPGNMSWNGPEKESKPVFGDMAAETQHR
jgi:hypothetical protein